MEVLREHLAKEVFVNVLAVQGGAKANAVAAHALGDDVLETRERTGNDEEHVGRVDLNELLLGVLAPALGRNRCHRAFQNLQECLLDTLPRDISGDGGVFCFAGNLVDLVDVDDAHFSALHVVVGSLDQFQQDVFDIFPHAMVRALDRSVGRILETLDQKGIADNTIVIFTSDNGGAGYIGLPDINAPYRGWKLTLYEGGVRVPMLVRWPNGLDAGTVTDTPVAHIDILPTVVAAAGAKLPETRVIDGVNILAPLTNPLQPAAERPLFWTSAYYQAVRKGNWKLQRSERPSGAWLYDLATDPTEQRNIVDQYPMIASELTALLDEYRANSRPPLYHHVLEGPVAVDKNLNDYFEDGDDYVYWPN